ncbi:Dam family site-specific DNA-(adenine-N6)-methyltransferase [Metallibacterium sp.]|uniref:DNA adenine methylase n=1 Tax=Metallibacterium sp. TaxID=2940281 RepID=UPI00261A8652|nr:Dam family site-specific DNA-(adenine-N6)-methyltransferase [Metallibacterium sp.]
MSSSQPAKRMTPFLKWAGGKRWLVANHAGLFPTEYNRYIEPFLGSGAVYFHLKPRLALLSDANLELIRTYQAVRDDCASVARILRWHQAMHSDEHYYAVRAEIPDDATAAAARFIYLNRTCWNGLYRVNRRGEFNVPRGTKDTVVLDSDNFHELARVLKCAILKHGDFKKSIDAAGSGDLLFVDPPYTVKHNHNGFIKYNDKIFSWEDQIRLRDSLVRADSRGAMVVMTNANHASVRDLYEGFNQFPLTRQSVLSGLAEARGVTEELLVTNVG